MERLGALDARRSDGAEPAGGATLVLVHGFGLGAWMWERDQQLLAAAGHTSYAVDLPGHGADAGSDADLDSLVSGSVISDNGYTWGGGDNPGVYMAMTSNTIIEASDISDNDGNGVVLTNQGMANDPSMTCSSENLFSRNEISNNGRFGFSITHSTCTDNRSEENVTRDNAWGPVFETTCGQLDIVGNICEGPGCKATCVN